MITYTLSLIKIKENIYICVMMNQHYWATFFKRKFKNKYKDIILINYIEKFATLFVVINWEEGLRGSSLVAMALAFIKEK